jgi:ribosomal protein L11 methyltransferase
LADYPALDLTYSQDPHTPELLELLYACLDDFEPLAIHENETGDGLRVFFRNGARRDEAAAAVERAFAGRLERLNRIEVPDERWAERSQAQLTPVRVGAILVAPPWAASEDAADHVVVIQPSMGFGTGHHATTRLCLQLLQERPLTGARVIDIGTGSGVLAIAAWKLGATRIVAIDCDPDALENARENLELNGASGAIELMNADLSVFDAPAADTVTGNLTSAVLQRHARELRRSVRAGGQLIVSGFAPGDLPAIEGAFGARSSEALTEDAWCAARFVNLPRQT